MKVFLRVLAIAVFISTAVADLIELDDVQGRSIKAELIRKTGDVVSVLRDNGRTYDIPLARFSEESKRKIEEWEIAQSRKGPLLMRRNRLSAFVAFNKKDKLDLAENFDDRIVRFSPRVKIVNDDIRNGYRAVKCTLVIVGESVLDKDVRKVLSMQEFRIDIPRSDSVTWSGENFKVEYDDVDNGELFGYKLDGYIFMIQNGLDEVVFSYASSEPWIKPEYKVFSLKENREYDRTLTTQLN